MGYSALNKKVRTGEITNNAKDNAVKNFRKDCNNRFTVLPLTAIILKRAGELINKHGTHFSIRTLDAIQLTVCMEEKTDDMEFVCADLNLVRICNLEGVKAINPEAAGVSEG